MPDSTLPEHTQEPVTVVPDAIRKSGSTVRVHGYVCSTKARHRTNVAFVGTMQENYGMPEEHIIGHIEMDKFTGRIDEANIRYCRFDDLKGVVGFSNILLAYINKRLGVK